MGKYKQTQNAQRHQFLLTFFKDGEESAEVNGYILKKYFSNSTHRWEVAIYTKESFIKYAEYVQQQAHMQSIRSEMDG